MSHPPHDAAREPAPEPRREAAHFCPAYPPPAPRRLGLLRMLLGKRRSWLDGLYERSYAMQMGEVHLPGLSLYMVNERALVRRVLVDEAADFPKSPLLAEALRPVTGHSIFTAEGADWARQRALMAPAFEAAGLSRSFAAMQAACADLVARLPQGVPLDAQIEMTHVSADIIFRTLFSTPLHASGSRQLYEAFSAYQALAPRLLLPAMSGLRWLRPWWLTRRSRQAAEAIRSAIAQRVDARLAEAPPARNDATPDAPRDLLDALIAARDTSAGPEAPRGFDRTGLIDQAAMLFLAGHETSASALAWALHLLAHDPSVQQRLRDEVLAAFGTDEAISADALMRLPLLRHVLRETLRLFPPVGFLPREARCPVRMRDKSVPAGASVVVSPWLIHRHRGFWQNPDAFDPDRFADPAQRDAAQGAWLPFGLGPRMCIGAGFALQEAALVLATVLRRWQVVPLPGHVPEPVGRLTIRSANGIMIVLQPRSPE